MPDVELPREPIVSASGGVKLPQANSTRSLDPPCHLKEFVQSVNVITPPSDKQIEALVDGTIPSPGKINPEKVKTGLESAFKSGKVNNMDAAAALFLSFPLMSYPKKEKTT